MGGESSKSDTGSDGDAGRRKSIDAINAVFVANVCYSCFQKFYNCG